MSKITKKRHKHKAFDNNLLDKFGITEVTDKLKQLIEDHDKAGDRILNPFQK